MPRGFRPGTVVIHRDGRCVVLSRRKDDDSGWWILDPHGGGLSDRVFNDGDWEVIDQMTGRFVFELVRLARKEAGRLRATDHPQTKQGDEG